MTAELSVLELVSCLGVALVGGRACRHFGISAVPLALLVLVLVAAWVFPRWRGRLMEWLACTLGLMVFAALQ